MSSSIVPLLTGLFAILLTQLLCQTKPMYNLSYISPRLQVICSVDILWEYTWIFVVDFINHIYDNLKLNHARLEPFRTGFSVYNWSQQ